MHGSEDALLLSEELNDHFIRVCRQNQPVAHGPCALLLGVRGEANMICMGLWVKSNLHVAYTPENCSEALHIYPAGLRVIGVVYSSNAARLASRLELPTDGYAISYYNEHLSGWYHTDRRMLNILPSSRLSAELAKSHSIVRVQHTLLADFVHNSSSASLQRCQRQLLRSVAEEIRECSVTFDSGLTVDMADTMSSLARTALEDCLDGYIELETAAPDTEQVFTQKKRVSKLKRMVSRLKGKKGKRPPSEFPAMSVRSNSGLQNLTFERTYGTVTDLALNMAPRIICCPEELTGDVYTTCIPLTVDVVMYVGCCEEMLEVMAVLERLLLVLYDELIQQLILDDIAIEGKATSTELRTFQFEPKQVFCPISGNVNFWLSFSAPLTCVLGTCAASYRLKRKINSAEVQFDESQYEWWAEWEDDESLLSHRRNLHWALGIPYNRPVFRVVCAVDITSECNAPNGGNHLLDVHLGVPPPALQGARQYLVDGHYEYYHYMHNGVDDRGWGCAYRSLQTLASWFRWNKYTDIDVPTHLEIQRALVRVGDKPATFIGSRDWIGSLEVGFYLGEVLGVEWKNIMVNQGPALATKARELAMHFEMEGTPVMIGGGKLALTLLGVAWNEDNGEVLFLILDPHFTGPDSLETIQQKQVVMEGYRAAPCSWRTAQSFSRTTFYSLCLPKRPKKM